MGEEPAQGGAEGPLALSLREDTVLKGITHPNNHSVLKEHYKVGIITSILHLKQLMQDSCLVWEHKAPGRKRQSQVQVYPPAEALC